MFLCCAVLGTAVFFTSCGETEGNGPVLPPVDGVSVFLPNSVDSTATFTMEFDDAWQINNSNVWFYMSPMSGDAGVVEITVYANDTNPDMKERTGGFTIACGEKTIQCYVIQDVTPGFAFPDSLSFSGAEKTDYEFSFDANVGEINLSTDADWITFGEITVDSLQLEGGSISKYMTYNVPISFSENSGDAARSAVINVNGETESIERTFFQLPYMGEDFSKDFLRRSLAVRFTSTNCGYCPMMNEALRMASEENPGRFVIMNVYGNMGGGDFIFGQCSDYMRHFDASGFPTGIMNYYASVPNYQSVQTTKGAFVSLANEAVAQLPSNTAIIGNVSIESSEIVVTAYVASKSAGEYYINAFLCEDGLIAYQNGGSSNYQHDNVVISAVSDHLGDPVNLVGEGMKEVTYRFAIPSSVENPDNLHVVLFTSYDGEFRGSVSTAEYGSWDYVVDNVVSMPADGTNVEFAYEN